MGQKIMNALHAISFYFTEHNIFFIINSVSVIVRNSKAEWPSRKGSNKWKHAILRNATNQEKVNFLETILLIFYKKLVYLEIVSHI